MNQPRQNDVALLIHKVLIICIQPKFPSIFCKVADLI
jgi:hypothetical protein